MVLNGLDAQCKVTVLRLKNCCHCRAQAIARFLSTSLVELDLEGNNMHVHPLEKAKTKASTKQEVMTCTITMTSMLCWPLSCNTLHCAELFFIFEVQTPTLSHLLIVNKLRSLFLSTVDCMCAE